MRSVLLATLAFLGGCLLTTDTDGIAGTAPVDGGAVDGASSSSGGTPVDAGTDTGTSAGSCLGSHVFCTNFDDTNALPVPGWSSSSTAGTVTLDTTGGVSPPSSLRAAIKGTSTANAYLYRETFFASVKALTLSFAMRINDCPAQGTSSVTFAYIGLSKTVAVGFVIRTTGELALGAQVGANNTFFNLNKSFTKGAWGHGVIKITLKDATTSHLTMTVDGQASVDTDAPSGAPAQSMLFNIGASGSAAPNGCDVSFDDVVLDQE